MNTCETKMTGAGCVRSSAGLLTYVSPSRLDDDGAPAASLLLNLGHALPGLLVRVVCCTNCDFVLDAAQTVQLNAPFTSTRARRGSREWGEARTQDEAVSRRRRKNVARVAIDKNKNPSLNLFLVIFLLDCVFPQHKQLPHDLPFFPGHVPLFVGDLAGNKTVLGAAGSWSSVIWAFRLELEVD